MIQSLVILTDTKTEETILMVGLKEKAASFYYDKNGNLISVLGDDCIKHMLPDQICVTSRPSRLS
jgi:hypothetical protein